MSEGEALCLGREQYDFLEATSYRPTARQGGAVVGPTERLQQAHLQPGTVARPRGAGITLVAELTPTSAAGVL
eukprot:10872100-Alexandrium_andersonii.AAC.1